MFAEAEKYGKVTSRFPDHLHSVGNLRVFGNFKADLKIFPFSNFQVLQANVTIFKDVPDRESIFPNSRLSRPRRVCMFNL